MAGYRRSSSGSEVEAMGLLEAYGFLPESREWELNPRSSSLGKDVVYSMTS
jgi:hypothetical protein